MNEPDSPPISAQYAEQNEVDSSQVPGRKQPNPAARRILVADGIRGIAAFLIVLDHNAKSYLHYLTAPKPGSPLISVHLFPGLELAVAVFITLSGFVLSLPLWQSDRVVENYTEFVAKRAIRLLPPYLISMSIAFIVEKFIFRTSIPGSTLLAPTWSQYLEHVFLIFNWNKAVFSIGFLYWSIATEFQLYLIFPFIQRLLRQRLSFALWSMAPFLMLMLVLSPLRSNPGLLQALQRTPIALLPNFVIGIAAAKVVGSKKIGTAHTAVGVALVLVGFALNSFLFFTPLYQPPYFSYMWTTVIAGVGVGLILARGDSGSVSRILSSRVLVYLGMISYTLYVTHDLVAHALYKVLAPLEANHRWVAYWISVAMGVAFAALVYPILERPFHNLSRKFGKLKRTL